MAHLSSTFHRRWILIPLLAPASLFSQITIRERVDIAGAPAKLAAVATLGTLPTLRFEYVTCCLGYPTTLIANTPLGTITAQGTGGVVLTIPNAPCGMYTLNLMEEVGWLTNVGLEARERIYIDDTMVRSATYLKTGGPGYVRWTIPAYQTPVKIQITLASSELVPLGDFHNKTNPNYSSAGPDMRAKILDLSKVKTTPMSVMVSNLDGSPVSNYRLTFQAFGKDTTGGHKHEILRPGGRFVTSLGAIVYLMQQRTDTEGKVQTTYYCSGIGGTDSIYVRGTLPTDTATALVSVRVKDLMELPAGTHYELIGWTARHPKNHFGTKKTITKLQMLADTAYAHSSWILRFNDMSLVNGGPFDCSLSYEWNTPHENHREGVSLDLDDVATATGGNKVITAQKLSEWIEMVQGKDRLSIGDEVTHFHVTVK
jgi:hypothetical protein